MWVAIGIGLLSMCLGGVIATIMMLRVVKYENDRHRKHVNTLEVELNRVREMLQWRAKEIAVARQYLSYEHWRQVYLDVYGVDLDGIGESNDD